LEKEDWDNATELLDSGDVIELEVVGMNKGGLLVEFGRLRGFVPNSHTPGMIPGADRQKKNEIKREIIGSTIALTVLEVNRRRKRLILSGKVAEQKERKKRLEELTVGETVTGTVTNIVDFGAFIDLGAVDGLLHISEIAWHEVKNPADEVTVGAEIEVMVQDVDVDRERVSLSRKALLPSPWDTLTERYDEGDLVEGRVTNVTDFGAFVELEDGLEGLIHKSEMGVVGFGSPEVSLQPNDTVLVRIIDLDPENKRIGLSTSRVTYEEELAWMEKRREAEQAEAAELEEQAAMAAEASEAEPTLEAEASAETEAEEAGEMEESREAVAGAEVEGETELAEEVPAEGIEAESEATPEAASEVEVEPEAEGETEPAEEVAEEGIEAETETTPEAEAEGQAHATESEDADEEGEHNEAEAEEEMESAAAEEEEEQD
jgi:small subunit ribosomal protein S1